MNQLIKDIEKRKELLQFCADTALRKSLDCAFQIQVHKSNIERIEEIDNIIKLIKAYGGINEA